MGNIYFVAMFGFTANGRGSEDHTNVIFALDDKS